MILDTKELNEIGITHCRRLWKKIFNIQTLSHSEVNERFDELDSKILSAITFISETTRWTEFFLHDVISEIAAGITRNRKIFNSQFIERRKETEFSGIPILETPKSGVPADHLWSRHEQKSIMSWVSSLNHGSLFTQINSSEETLSCPIVDGTEIIKSLGIARVVLEQLLGVFLSAISSYIDSSWELAFEILEHGYSKEASDKYATLLSREEEIGACSDLFGVHKRLLYEEKAISEKKYAILSPFLRLLLKLSAKNAASEAQQEDNFQNGFMGLVVAVSYFERGNGRFAPYATNWIRQSILYWLKSQANLIRIPPGVWQKYNALEKVREDLLNGNRNGNKSVHNLPDGLEKKVKGVKSAKDVYAKVSLSNVLSLDFSSEDGTQSFGDAVSENDLLIEEDTSKENVSELESLLSSAKSRGLKFLLLYTGLSNLIPSNLTAKESYKERQRQLRARQILSAGLS